jgi:hypothetical protein
MSKRTFISSSTVFILAMGVAALAAEEVSREEALARELLAVTGGGEMGLQMMEQMIQSLAAGQPGMSQEFSERFLAEVDPTELDELLVPVYVKHLTAAEMEATLEFYRSPAGQSILQKMPLVMAESVRLGQQWGMEVAQRVVEKMEQEERAVPTP